MFIKAIRLAAVSSLFVAVLATSAQAADAKKLYMTCAASHGKDGKTTLMPLYPKIAGQNRDYILQQIKDIMSGARANGQSLAMKGVLVTPEGKPRFSDEDLAALADYISQMTP